MLMKSPKQEKAEKHDWGAPELDPRHGRSRLERGEIGPILKVSRG